MSFITYSTDGNTVMGLTSDRTAIQEGLSRLRNVVPTGATNMQEALKLANEQIEKEVTKDIKATSLIITLTAGTLLPETYDATRNEANKARGMKAKVYSVGLKDYDRKQLLSIVESEHQMYGRDGYNSSDDFVNSLVENSCSDVMGKDTFFVCVAARNTMNVTKEKLICPGHIFEMEGESAVIDYSLDNGATFQNLTLKMISKNCVSVRVVP
ncbi:anthrax toxin receptor-like [Molossus molossus]|uniref:anthrax toxin receptor-like n=1 Tax=Molossus molossus TaxID=27622 RepID=UPI001746E6FD|nr:anthrax toxin receptor-like [Molossus molossus]